VARYVNKPTISNDEICANTLVHGHSSSNRIQLAYYKCHAIKLTNVALCLMSWSSHSLANASHKSVA
jgi:hypothetical protein